MILATGRLPVTLRKVVFSTKPDGIGVMENVGRGGAGIENSCNLLESLAVNKKRRIDDWRCLCHKAIGASDMFICKYGTPKTSGCWEGRDRGIPDIHWPDTLGNP